MCWFDRFRNSLSSGNVSYSSLPALFDTIHASHATAVIDDVVFGIDARGFAVAGTRLATVTFCRVDNGAEKRESGQ